jgi:large subunit ribosomal protein L22
VDLIRGLPLERAKNVLRFTPKKASPFLLKLLGSAEANLKHKGVTSCWVSHARVGAGPIRKGSMPRAQGRATPIRKRTSHIWIELTER